MLLPYVDEQPMKSEQLPASLFEANALSCAYAHGSEVEWSQQAPAAKRSRQVRQCVCTLPSCQGLSQSVFSVLCR